MANIKSQKIQVDGLNIHYVTGGEGDPIIVIHGGASGANTWMKNVAELAKSYTVYAPDLPGFGRSQSMEGDLRIPELVKFVDEFACKLGLKTFHLIGHSLGGAIATNYVLKFPHKIRKLVLISSMCLGREIALWVRFLSNCVFCRIIGIAVIGTFRAIKWLVEELFAGLEFIPPLSKASILLGCTITTVREQTVVLLHRLSEIMVPTLIVWGAKDPIVPVKQAHDAAKLISQCQIKVFEDCGHSVYRDRVPEFSHLVTNFLE